MKLSVIFKPQPLKVKINAAHMGVNFGTPVVKEYVDAPAYTGEYTVTPAEYEQVLETQGKRMTDNVTVAEVPFGLATTAQINRLFT